MNQFDSTGAGGVSAALQAMVNRGGSIHFPPGQYRIPGDIHLPPGHRIAGNPDAYAWLTWGLPSDW